MKKVREFFSHLSQEIQFTPFLRKAGTVLGAVLFIVSLINIAAPLYETRATKGIVFAKDNDAGRGIQTATLTRWWNSNHFAPYGNVYFRVAHTIATLTPTLVTDDLVPDEQIEVRHHFALLLTSLFFLSALCLFLAFLLTGSLTGTFWVGTVFLHLGIIDPTWVEFLFRVHPDHALMFMCAVSAYFTLKYTKTRSDNDFIRAALMWGLATAVKRSTILFIPSFLYLFLADGVNRQSLMKGLKFVGYMLVSYLIIGFPQNFGFFKHIWFMYIETFNSLPATKESILDYLGLMTHQSVWIISGIVVFHLLFGKQENLINRRFSIFTVIALLVVLASNMKTSHNHHIMPHVALILIFAIALVKSLPVLNFPRKNLFLIISSAVALFFLSGLDQTLLAERNKQLECRPEIRQALTIVGNFQKEGKRLIRDPYFPFSTRYNKETKQIWGVNGEILDKENAYLWGTQRTFLRSLQEKPYRPHIYPDLTLEQWNAKVALTYVARKDSAFSTPAGVVFEKIYADACGYMIWKRKE